MAPLAIELSCALPTALPFTVKEKDFPLENIRKVLMIAGP
jgi:hypothetical protein